MPTPNSATFENSGSVLSYIVQGEGFPVVMIHGMAASHHDWDRFIPVLSSAGFQVYAPDLLGHGESHKPDNPAAYTTLNLYTELENWIQELKLPQTFFLVGHSLGGYLSLEYASRHPDRVQGMVLFDPLFTPHQISPVLKRLLRHSDLGEKALRHSPTWLISTVMGLDPLASSIVPRPVRRQTALDYKRAAPHIMRIPASMEDLSAQISGLQIPARVIWGKLDLTLNPASFHRLVALLPVATGHALDRTGHQPHIQRPRVVHQLVLDFLRQHASEMEDVSTARPSPPEIMR